MIEEWIVKFALMCFAVMGMAAWALNEIAKFGEDYIDGSDEKGEDE